jgi:glycosyltransferase involved in cell wall biosynthesis
VVDSKGDTEGLGVVLLEALRAGVPVVASGAGGIPDIVRDGETGWLVPPGDVDELARAISEVALAPEEAARRVDCGQKHSERHFSLDGIVGSLARCYEGARTARTGTSRTADAR